MLLASSRLFWSPTPQKSRRDFCLLQRYNIQMLRKREHENISFHALAGMKYDFEEILASRVLPKDIYEVMNIKKNPARAWKIIEEFIDFREERKRKAKLPLSQEEEEDILLSFLSKESMQSIELRTGRRVKPILKRHLPEDLVNLIALSKSTENYFLEDVYFEYKLSFGQLVYSLKYSALAEVRELVQLPCTYAIYVLGERERQACQPATSLVFLKNLKTPANMFLSKEEIVQCLLLSKASKTSSFA